MQKFYGFFYSLENKISKYSIEEGVLPDFAERRKAKLLSNDLATIGHQVSMNLLPPIPEIRNLAYAIGCLYVVEGSTLGGGFIFKLLNENLQLTVFKGASYFYGYGKETGNKWKVFIENLERFNEKENKESDIIAGVVDTFSNLIFFLNK